MACVAYVLGKSYQETVLEFGVKQAIEPNFFCRDLVRVLNRHEKNYAYKRLRRKKDKSKMYREGTIVFIRKNRKYPFGHYLARAESYWMDPWLNVGKDKDIKNAISGFRKRLPGEAIYIIFQKNS